MIRANIWLAITTMCGPVPITTPARSARPGVALAMSRNTRKALISWWPINERMLEARFEHRHGKLTIIVAYAPTNLAENDKKQTSMPFCKTLLAQDRRMTLLSFYLTLMQLSLETLALTGRMLLAPHSSTEPPKTMATASCRSAEAQTMRHTVPCIPRRPTREHRSPSPMRKHTTETEGTSGLTPAPPTRHLAPGGPLNQAAVPV